MPRWGSASKRWGSASKQIVSRLRLGLTLLGRYSTLG